MNRQLTSTTTASLEPLDSGDSITGPLFAINWFNTRRAWLYDLYNLLAAGPLFRIGGAVVLKAKHRKTIVGAPTASRELLLVVHYPSGDRFLDLLANRLFQIVSALRILAVKDFSFVLHKRRDMHESIAPGEHDFAGDKSYAIHHFCSPGPLKNELPGLAALMENQNISLFFASEKAAAVVIDTGPGRRKTMPFETHKLLIFEAESQEALEEMLTGAAFGEFSTTLQSSYTGIFDRVM